VPFFIAVLKKNYHDIHHTSDDMQLSHILLEQGVKSKQLLVAFVDFCRTIESRHN